jgi:membrane-bound inhibitor of C-type lysozyme
MTRASLIIGLALLSVTVIIGCGKQEEPLKAQKPATAPRLLVYQCSGGQGFVVEVDEKGDSALLKMDGQSVKLPQVPSGSGAKYNDGKTTLWTKGDEAFVEVDGVIIMKDCRIRKGTTLPPLRLGHEVK